MAITIIGIAGGSASGKTTVVRKLGERFGNQIQVLGHDNYYRSHDGMPFAQRAQLNYDHPDAFETEYMVRHIQELKAGHAIQHGKGYAFLKVRNAIFPVVRIASSLAIPLLLAGLLLEVAALYDVALILYATAIVFQLITLPVEFNASRRATDILAAEGYLDYGEVQGAQKVLRAAALTYIASFLLSLLQFLRLLAITGSRRD